MLDELLLQLQSDGYSVRLTNLRASQTPPVGSPWRANEEYWACQVVHYTKHVIECGQGLLPLLAVQDALERLKTAKPSKPAVYIKPTRKQPLRELTIEDLDL